MFSGVSPLEWSGVPVCRPVTLLSLSYWQHSLHAKSVVCQARDDILLIWDNWRGRDAIDFIDKLTSRTWNWNFAMTNTLDRLLD